MANPPACSGRSDVRRHCAFAGRTVLKPLAICLQCRGNIVANTATPNTQRRRHRNVRQGEARTHKEFTVAELVTYSAHGVLEPRLDSHGRPIALLIVRCSEANRKEGCHK